ncbi:hypothetical protein DV515_00011557 [Chloebia gouldiae]|uniref:Uncharacterized protein n=1 Tax=Chloebia gouldiae TaxID=44316 RepID=A0A3L8S729_CHLGU|nr:hypothetical protein DV515_00011557 [Chloebia gouldiae]
MKTALTDSALPAPNQTGASTIGSYEENTPSRTYHCRVSPLLRGSTMSNPTPMWNLASVTDSISTAELRPEVSAELESGSVLLGTTLKGASACTFKFDSEAIPESEGEDGSTSAASPTNASAKLPVSRSLTFLGFAITGVWDNLLEKDRLRRAILGSTRLPAQTKTKY